MFLSMKTSSGLSLFKEEHVRAAATRVKGGGTGVA
jgi:hypothetical protein